MRTLDNLWLGNIAPIESSPKSGEYRKTLRRLVEDQEILRKTLSEEGLSVLSSYEDAQITLQALAERSAFAQGFRLGAKIILDVLEDGGE